MQHDDHVTLLSDPGLPRHDWAAGLEWKPRETGDGVRRLLPFRSASTARRQGLPVVATPRPKTRRRSPLPEGRGVIPFHYRSHTLYSLALAFCDKVADGYGVYRLDSTDFVFLASISGMPAIVADITGNAGKMQETLALFLALNDEPETGWVCHSAPDAPLDWSSLIHGLSPRQRRRCRLVQPDRAARQAAMTLLSVLLVCGGMLWWVNRAPAVDAPPTAEELRARAREFMTEPAPVPRLPHPWATIPSVSDLLAGCAAQDGRAPVMLDGWKLTSGYCRPDGVSLVYLIQPGGTAEGLRQRSMEIFGVEPVFNVREGGREATIPLPLPEMALHDEAVPEPSAQMMRILSWFQRQQILPNLNKVAQPDPLPGTDGRPPAKQDWEEYQFSFTGTVPPLVLFAGFDGSGLRLSSVKFEINGTVFTYTTEGQMYASKP